MSMSIRVPAKYVSHQEVDDFQWDDAMGEYVWCGKRTEHTALLVEGDERPHEVYPSSSKKGWFCTNVCRIYGRVFRPYVKILD